MQSGPKTTTPFARAYDWIWTDPRLQLAEKAVLTQVCRFLPKQCHASAATIGKACGLSDRYVRRIISGLCQGPKARQKAGLPPRKAYLKKEFSHVQTAEPKSVRWLTLRFNPEIGGGPVDPPNRNVIGGPTVPLVVTTPGPTDPPPPGSTGTIGGPTDPPNRNREKQKEEGDASPSPAWTRPSASPTADRDPTPEEQEAGRQWLKQHRTQNPDGSFTVLTQALTDNLKYETTAHEIEARRQRILKELEPNANTLRETLDKARQAP